MPTMNRRAAKRDLVEPAIIAALRSAGASVVQLSDRGLPDLLVAFPMDRTRPPENAIDYETILMEVKTGSAKLTEDEQSFFAAWKGRAWIVRTPEDALTLIEVPVSEYSLHIK